MDLLYLPFPTKNKASLCREESKGVWRLGDATFVNFVRVHCICLYNTNLILSTRHDFFLQHSF